MKTRAKTFDCVEMKDRIQQELRREYEARRKEFASFADFIVATAAESKEVQAYWRKVAGGKERKKRT